MFDKVPAIVIPDGAERRSGIHARKWGNSWSFRNRALCRRGFRVGFEIRACGFCRVRRCFKRPVMLEAARN